MSWAGSRALEGAVGVLGEVFRAAVRDGRVGVPERVKIQWPTSWAIVKRNAASRGVSPLMAFAALTTIRRSAGRSTPEQPPRPSSSIRRPRKSSAIDSTGTGISRRRRWRDTGAPVCGTEVFTPPGFFVQELVEFVHREANVFGAELLVPEAAVRDAWAAFPDRDELAEHFGVSALAAQWRLYSFGLVERPP